MNETTEPAEEGQVVEPQAIEPSLFDQATTKARNLFAEAAAAQEHNQHENTEVWARRLYYGFVILGTLLAVDLYTRPDPPVLKAFGVITGLMLGVSDMAWASATHHSARGAQRKVAYFFWGVGLVIFGLNAIVEYSRYLGYALGVVGDFYLEHVSMMTFVFAMTGWALYLLTSPNQRFNDIVDQWEERAMLSFEQGMKRPDEAMLEEYNRHLLDASREIAGAVSNRVRHRVEVLSGRLNGNGNGQHPK